MNLRALRMDSTYSRIARVRGSSAKWSSRSPKSTSSASPIDTTAENPTERASPHSTMPTAIAPDCDTRARSPGAAGFAAKLALSPACGDITPRQLGPITRRPEGRAALASSSASEPGPCPSPAVITIAALTPAAAASATTRGTMAGGVVTTTSSGTQPSAAMLAAVAMPSMSRWRGLTTPSGPAKPPSRRLRSTMRPTERSRGLAPTTATDRGWKTEPSP